MKTGVEIFGIYLVAEIFNFVSAFVLLETVL